ncbi:MAG: tetratricopeptide repeat protein, partial [Planctomycetota bacterium]
ATLGNKHPDLASVLYAYALLHRATGDEAGAEPLLREVAQIQADSMEPGDLRLIGTRAELARCLSALEKHDEAIAEAQACLDTLLASGAPDSPVASTAAILADLLDAAGKHDRAESVRQTYLKSSDQSPDDPSAQP